MVQNSWTAKRIKKKLESNVFELKGSRADEKLFGNRQDNALSGGAGSDILDGGAGDDSLTSKSLSGNHDLQGGVGNDRLTATGKTVNLDGGDGNDTLTASGRLTVSGSTSYVEEGEATLDGGSGDDSLSVSNYDEAQLFGGADDDNLRASTLVGHVRILSLNLCNGGTAFFLCIGGRCDCRVDRFAKTRDFELIHRCLRLDSRFVAIRRARVDAFQKGNC